jgi:ABC-type nitrate/sulfonate/bicarbonate transport system permease component
MSLVVPTGRHRRPTLIEHLWTSRTRILAGLAAATIGGLIFGMFVGVFT